MKEGIKIAILTIAGVLAVIFVYYLLFGFIVWVFNDPLNIIPDVELPSTTSFENLPAYQECVKRGGVPIKSEWTGEVKRCDKP